MIRLFSLLAIFIIGFMPVELSADELTHKFKSPSFSGIGTSAHYLTIENQEKTRRDKIRDDIEAALLALSLIHISEPTRRS